MVTGAPPATNARRTAYNNVLDTVVDPMAATLGSGAIANFFTVDSGADSRVARLTARRVVAVERFGPGYRAPGTEINAETVRASDVVLRMRLLSLVYNRARALCVGPFLLA